MGGISLLFLFHSLYGMLLTGKIFYISFGSPGHRRFRADVTMFLISSENIPCVYFVFHVIKAGIVAVGKDGAALLFKGFEIVYYPAAEESGTVF